jgi:hypothetical protein
MFVAKRQHQEHLDLVSKMIPNLDTQEANMYEDIKRLLKKVRHVLCNTVLTVRRNLNSKYSPAS